MHRIALGCFVALIALSAQAADAPVAWRRVVMHEVKPGEVGAEYRRVHALAMDWPDTARGRRDYANAVPRYRSDASDFRDKQSGGAGMWSVIAAPTDGGWPTQMLLVLPESTKTDYRVAVHAWCEEAVACAALRERAEAVPAPRPFAAEPVMAQWRAIVLAEPCAPGPPRTTTFPISRWQDEITNPNVRLRVLTNPCGDVREASVVQSSGSRDADRWLAERALRLRVDGKSTTGILPLTISFD